MRKTEGSYAVSIDEMLIFVGEYGRFQKLVNFILCLTTFPPVFHIMIMYFAADDPDWKCAANSTTCLLNGTFSTNDDRRCVMSRSEWDFVEPPEYSIVTYFDIHCNQRWTLELLESILFVGWILGSFILGWFCDHHGRKLILIVSVNIVMVMGFASVFMPSLQYIIACRFVIGFFLPGTMIQCFIIMTEIVGGRYRPFAGMMIFASSTLCLTVLGVKAYFIRNWKYLHVACTVPYIFLLFFYNFLPESIRYLRVRGKMDKLMICFQRIASWNNTEIPANVYIFPPPEGAINHKLKPSRLFRNAAMAGKTLVQSFVYFTTGIVYYGVFLAAGEMSGSMYRDYILICACEIPINFISIDFCQRFGRKKATMIPMLFVVFSCISLSFTPNVGHAKIARVITGIISKSFVGCIMNTMSTWSSELYTTQVRGEAMGFFQGFARVGAAGAPWLDKEFVKIHKAASFLFMASVSFISFIILALLPETKNTITADTDDDEKVADVVAVPAVLKFVFSAHEEQRMSGYRRLRSGSQRPYSYSCVQF